MQELQKKLIELQTSFDDAQEVLQIKQLEAELAELQKQSTQPDFWSDTQAAQAVMRQLGRLQARVEPWQDLRSSIHDLVELVQLQDESLQNDIESQYQQTQQKYNDLKQQLKFAGPYDDHDAIVSIYAGAGGTDAQDWAGMLLRMYVRWAEKQRYEVKTLEQADGEEAGLKSVTLEIAGNFIYGKLKSEHGVHRLVRLSPFNADNLRQTSFAKVEVMPKIDKPNEVLVDEKDLKIDVYRSGGHGGQSVNTTDSAVRITHLHTGIVVAIQNERSQLQNKETALTILRSKLAQLQIEQHKENLQELKGPNLSAEWGNQIRSYVLHPYKQVKDLRTRYETSDPDAVLDGALDAFIDAYLDQNLASEQ